MSATHFRDLLERGDVRGLVAAWSQMFPDMPRPDTLEHAEIAMHLARTGAASVTFKLRAWSHRWLTERALPSQLPDELKPNAEQLCPVVQDCVGISVNTRSPYLKPAMLEVRGAMENAVNDAYADGRREPAFVKARMFEARDKTLQALFGK